MKKILTITSIIIVVSAMAFTSFDEGNARVEKRNGIDIYVLSNPTQDYEIIESGKATVLVSCNEIINKSVKNAKKANADGVIIYWEQSRYDAIKYK